MTSSNEETAQPSSSKSSLRVATWNILHSPVDIERRTRLAAVELAKLDCDVVLLQEVAYTAGVSTARVIADELGMELVADNSTGEAVLVRTGATVTARSIDLGGELVPGTPGSFVAASVATLCHDYVFVSAHLAWGSGMESARLAQVIELDARIAAVASLEPFRAGGNGVIAVLAGDLNAEPHADSIRYLTGVGVQNGKATLWNDSWRRGEGPGVTSAAGNPLSAATAEAVEIGADGDLPDRRIDYVMVRGYAYGRPGAPLSARVFGDEPDAEGCVASDHYGLTVELRC